LDILEPYSTENGGPLIIQHVSFVEGRGNIIVEYPGEDPEGIISFVGAHLDVVTANPETWDFDPFTLTRDGDKLRGRGTTDCLGHVALMAELFRQLGEKKPKLKKSVVGVWIANEENSKVIGAGLYRCCAMLQMAGHHCFCEGPNRAKLWEM
jgi:acetylornithine deacetylase